MTPPTAQPDLETPVLPGFEQFEDDTSETDSASAATGLSPVGPSEVRAAPAPIDPGATSETASTPKSKSKSTPEETGSVRVLIVDDESAMCAMTGAIVESMGYVPVTAASGEEAIETYQKHWDRGEAIQAVIMDLALPGGISGLEATDALREIDEGVRVIASSGYLQQNARSAAIERGFAGILPKPYTAERLSAELRWVVTPRGRED